jgi:phage terminase large subunit
MAIWIVQWVGMEIRVLDYIEGVGQVLAYYVNELRSRGHGDAICVLPHDGVNTNNITGKRYEDHLREAEFEVRVVQNQGRGAAMMRVEAARRLFPRIRFNEASTEAGRDALGFYHEKRDPDRQIGLGPEHDWSSHGADAFGLMCVAYEEPEVASEPFYGHGSRRSGWLGS